MWGWVRERKGQNSVEVEPQRHSTASEILRELETPPTEFKMLGHMICQRLTRYQLWYLDQGCHIANSVSPLPFPKPRARMANLIQIRPY